MWVDPSVAYQQGMAMGGKGPGYGGGWQGNGGGGWQGGGGYKEGGGKGGPGRTPGECFEFRDKQTCSKGASCRFLHITRGDAATGTAGTATADKVSAVRKKEDPNAVKSGRVVDYADLENDPDGASCTLIDEKVVIAGLYELEEGEDGEKVPVNRVCLAPGENRDLCQKINSFCDKNTKLKGKAIGRKKAKENAQRVIKMFEDEGYEPRPLPEVAKTKFAGYAHLEQNSTPPPEAYHKPTGRSNGLISERKKTTRILNQSLY